MVLADVIAVLGTVAVVLVAAWAWRPRWLISSRQPAEDYVEPSGRLRVMALILAALVALGTLAAHGWAVRRTECAAAESMWKRSSERPGLQDTDPGYLITTDHYVDENTQSLQVAQYQLWHEGRLVAVWGPSGSASTGCGPRQ